MENLFLYCRLCNKLKKIALQDEWSARIVTELFEQYFWLEDRWFLCMSFILVLLFEQKRLKITMTYSESCWQTSGLCTPEYAKKKRRHEVWSYAVRLTERLGHAAGLWNNANNFLTIKLEVYVIFSPELRTYALFQSLAAQGCQFHSFRYCAVENTYEERLDGWHYILLEFICGSVSHGSAIQVVLLTAEDSCEYWGRKAEELNAWHFIKI